MSKFGTGWVLSLSSGVYTLHQASHTETDINTKYLVKGLLHDHCGIHTRKSGSHREHKSSVYPVIGHQVTVETCQHESIDKDIVEQELKFNSLLFPLVKNFLYLPQIYSPLSFPHN